MLTYDVDLFRMVEIEINWRNSRGWFENIRLSLAHNTTEKHKSKPQPGVIYMINSIYMVLYARDTGIDQRKLGRLI